MSVILKNKEGHIAIMTLVPGADKEDAIKKFKDVHPDYEEHCEGDIEFPKDRKYRDAWVMKGQKVDIDVTKAKEIHMSHVRHLRNEKLKELDVETIRAATNLKQLQAVETRKQVLRDLPQNIKLDGLDINEWPTEI